MECCYIFLGLVEGYAGFVINEQQVLSGLLKVRDLPTLPQVVMRILEAAEDENSCAADLTALLEQDHAISARALRLANSAFYGLRNQVDTIQRAVVVLGFDAVSQLALATSVFKTFSEQRQFALDPEDFWMHALGAAKAAHILSTEYCMTTNPDTCFTGGLLHDIGKYVMALTLPGQYHLIVAEAETTVGLLKDVEKEHLGFTHADVGGWIAEKWRFPQSTTDMIRNLYGISQYSGHFQKEVAIVALSAELSRKVDFGRAGDWKAPYIGRSLMSILGIARSDVDDICVQLDALREEARDFIAIMHQE